MVFHSSCPTLLPANAKCSSFSTSSLRHLLLFVVAFGSSHNLHFSDDL